MKKLEECFNNNKRGITLISLVITIIILLILAGVSIAMITGNNGILTQVTRAKEETEIASEKEAIQLTMINREMTDDEKYNIGEELRDRNLANGNDWKIISVNDTKQIYGTDWYYVGTGVSLENYGETKHNWLINYNTGEIIELEEDNFAKLAYGENLAVTDEIILNADPINMENGTSWGDGVTVHGIQEGDGYGWNETGFKLDGVDDYIEVYPQANVDTEKGLTFEFYGANNDNSRVNMLAKTIKGNTSSEVYMNKFRTFFQGDSFYVCMSNLASESDWSPGDSRKHWIENQNIGTFNSEDGGYLTMTIDTENNEVSLYWKGNLVGSTTCSHDWILGGGLTNNSIPFTIGLLVSGNTYEENYSKVNIYACRLYNKVLTADEVKANYDKTVAYHKVLVKGEK